MESRRNGPQLSSRHDDDDDVGHQLHFALRTYMRYLLHLSTVLHRLQKVLHRHHVSALSQSVR